VGIAEPFVQVVYDIEVPRMVFGRACLISDAAFAVRRHAAAGTAKAAADGWALAAELAAAGGLAPVALAAWERRQLKLEFCTYTRDEFVDEFVHPGDRAAIRDARQKRALQVRAEYLTEMRKKAA
jgi:2-polyprenyl-6-methoxyphenol hydroxylase-like FAD-dependent oxidoreductase